MICVFCKKEMTMREAITHDCDPKDVEKILNEGVDKMNVKPKVVRL